ncbi:MAG: glycosyltransferase family protein [Acidobacteria bacterium]|nr:glycosyltransferase family protein [Acidobacteriota bacterium]
MAAAGRGIDELFPHRLCINLDRRPDRWERVQARFAEQGLHSVERLVAADGNRLDLPDGWEFTAGAYGCLVSHLRAVREARSRNLPSLLLFEDDVVFDRGVQEKFARYGEELPDDWDMLFFGALHKEDPIRISDHLVRITKANSTYAYALRQTVFDDFIQLNEKALSALDKNNFVLQQKFNCYCFMPHLAWVEDDFSDAQERLERHWYLRESLVPFGAGMDRLLSETTLVIAHQGGGERAVSESLRSLLRHHQEYFAPYLQVIFVHCGPRPPAEALELPPGWRLLSLPSEDGFDRQRCFREALRSVDPGRKYLILSDSDLFVEPVDLRANLRMCQQYDGATGFGELIELTEADSRRLRESGSSRRLDLTAGPARGGGRGDGQCYFVNREAVQQRLNGESEGALTSLGALLADPRLRIFRSPNHALRLHRAGINPE